MYGQKIQNNPIRNLVIILILSLLAAFFIWRYFDYKIEKIKMGYQAIGVKSITSGNKEITESTFFINPLKFFL